MSNYLFQEGACDGDSGSPVIRRISKTSRGNPYFEQNYIVSTGLDCKLKATIYVSKGYALKIYDQFMLNNTY